MTSRWKRFACLWLIGLAVLVAPRWAEAEESPGRLTIIGRQDGTFLVVEQDGTTEVVAASSLTLGCRVSEKVVEYRKAQAERAAEKRQDAAAQAEEAATQRAAEEEAQKEAAAKRAAEAKRRAEAENERQAKIWSNYETKSYAYGPNSVPEVQLDDESTPPASSKGRSSTAQ